MHYNLTQVVPSALLALHDGIKHVQVLHLVLLLGKLLQVATPGFCNNYP